MIEGLRFHIITGFKIDPVVAAVVGKMAFSSAGMKSSFDGAEDLRSLCCGDGDTFA